MIDHPPDPERAARNRRRNVTQIQARIPIGVKIRLLREARRKRTTVSAIVATIVAAHFSVAP